MNYQLKEWTRQVAFQLSLSEPAIQALLEMHAWEKEVTSRGKCPHEYSEDFMGQRSMAGYLQRRGLIEVNKNNSGYVTTRAGGLTAELLIEAGFKSNRAAAMASMFPNSPVIS